LGFLSFFCPFIIFLFGSHFFNSKKLKIIKSNVSLGLVLIFLSFLGIAQSGGYGRLIFENLKQDFSIVGAILILSIIFIIGLILFLNTSVDSFILFIFDSLKLLISVAKKYLFREFLERRLQKKEKKKEKEEFIKDKKEIGFFAKKSAAPPSTSTLANQLQSSINIKPLSNKLKTAWIYPPLTLLSDVLQKEADRGDVKKNADIVEKTLDSFGIRARVVEFNEGPTVTQYALEIVRGTKLSRITALSNDLALALAAPTGQIRIEAPIPGRSLVGIEIPNKRPELVTLKKMLSSAIFLNNPNLLFVPLGLDVSGNPQAVDLAKMPHVLIAGTTGSGKSVLLNSWICTLLFRTKPEEIRMILVDPKRVELTLYNGIPHLLTEVIVDPKEIISALKWTVMEMESRYKIFAKAGARNIEGYNSLEEVERIPYIVLIIDELADLMVFAPGDAENLITRVAQMARATGIHLMLATQRPSVDVITGLMKANIPARIAFNVASMIDSRVVLDMPGAEKLLGRGDMLFLPPDQAKPRRIQGPFISEKEVQSIVKFLKQEVPRVHYTEEVVSQDVSLKTVRGGTALTGEEKDSLFSEAIEIISQFDKASASLLQRRLSIGYARAARILDQLEAEGYVGPSEGSKPREVLRRQTREDQSTEVGT
jgi:S-DNA-T family DNA segregation ATPase FtsK/SpoIIIE